MTIAIVAIAYNRVDCLSRLLHSLSQAYYDSKNIPLIISVDKSDTTAVEDFADSYNWEYGEKIVSKHSQNMGLKKHILSIGKWFDKYDALVVLEDDLVVSRNFYRYVFSSVNKYFFNDNIAGISLYAYNVNYMTYFPWQPMKNQYDGYFINCAISWGEVWLKNQWKSFMIWYESHKDFDYSPLIPGALFKWGEKSWLKFHTRYCVENNKYFLFPYTSLTTNFGDAGTNHHDSNRVYAWVNQSPLLVGDVENFFLPDFDKDAIKYDAFFENEALYECLEMSQKNCCLDLNGTKQDYTGRRYLLSTKKLHYKIVKSFGVAYHPIEVNVIEKVSGNDIFLYDTSKSCHNESTHHFDDVSYHFRICDVSFIIKKYGICFILHSIIRNCFLKVNYRLKCK